MSLRALRGRRKYLCRQWRFLNPKLAARRAALPRRRKTAVATQPPWVTLPIRGMELVSAFARPRGKCRRDTIMRNGPFAQATASLPCSADPHFPGARVFPCRGLPALRRGRRPQKRRSELRAFHKHKPGTAPFADITDNACAARRACHAERSEASAFKGPAKADSSQDLPGASKTNTSLRSGWPRKTCPEQNEGDQNDGGNASSTAFKGFTG